MKLPLNWLHEFVAIDAGIEELCRRLTMAGLEVENVDQLTPEFTDVFTAKVIHVERHPNADRLSLCEVDAGSAGRFRVVCGAPNVRAGMTAAFARIGARLGGGVHGHGTGSRAEAVPLQAATIRGVQSEGMLCSEMELGLSEDHQGIIELDPKTQPGMPLQDYLELPDTVLDIAITPNRGDCLSMVGLAREIAALFGLAWRPPKFRPVKLPENAARHLVKVEIHAPELCPRYAALAMDRIKLGQSPVWMRRRLESCGMRAVNNVVDITNYVMLEIGQPLHAFDATQIADWSIVVRRAGNDAEFETLDGVRRKLDPDDLMIADRDKMLAIAGVMGGRNSEVSAGTSSIILESAFFEPMTIARTSRRLGLRSEASYRFERGIDRAGQLNAILRAAELIGRIAGGKPSSVVLDNEPLPYSQRNIEIDVNSINSLLGISVAPSEIRRRLKLLGVSVEPAGRNRFIVSPPAFRPDINEPVDLAEEVARLSGLAEIPATLPARASAAGAPNIARSFVRRLREAITGCGLVEAKTIAFIAPAENERFPFFPAHNRQGAPVSEHRSDDEDPAVGHPDGVQPVQVINPLSAELSELRLSLVPGLLAALRFNLNREANSFHAFEIGKVFSSRDGIPGEAQRIAGVGYGAYAMGSVNHPGIKADFYTLKGVLEVCATAVGLRRDLIFTPLPAAVAPYLHPGRAALISYEGQPLGLLGELHPAESLRLELDSPCVLFELDLASLMAFASQRVQAIEPPPRFPAVRRDLALVVDRDFPAGTVIRTLSALNLPLLEGVELFDVYQGEPVPAGKKSVALACRYRSKDRTLTDEEVNIAHSALVEQAKAQLGAELRL
jgi:phenylalanyl-tRNA synthetase beta chain